MIEAKFTFIESDEPMLVDDMYTFHDSDVFHIQVAGPNEYLVWEHLANGNMYHKRTETSAINAMIAINNIYTHRMLATA